MASSVTAVNLTVTHTEQITLGTTAMDSSNQIIIPSIVQADKRIVNIPTASEVVVIAFNASAVAAGQFVQANVKYVRFTNLDDTNFVRLRVKKTGADTFDVKILAGETFIMSNTKESVSATAGAFSAFVDADSINMQADTAAVPVEYFVAST